VESCPRAQLVYVSLAGLVIRIESFKFPHLPFSLTFVREFNASKASKLQRVSSKKGLQRYMDAFTPHYITDLPIERWSPKIHIVLGQSANR
jgi:hypothetical protein